MGGGDLYFHVLKWNILQVFNFVSYDMILCNLSVYSRILIVPFANALGVYERKQRHLTPSAPLESAFKKYRGRVPHTEIEVSCLVELDLH